MVYSQTRSSFLQVESWKLQDKLSGRGKTSTLARQRDSVYASPLDVLTELDQIAAIYVGNSPFFELKGKSKWEFVIFMIRVKFKLTLS